MHKPTNSETPSPYRYIGGGSNIPSGGEMHAPKEILLKKVTTIMNSQGEHSRPGEPIEVRDARPLPRELGADSFTLLRSPSVPGGVSMSFYAAQDAHSPVFTVVLGPNSISTRSGTRPAPEGPEFLGLMSKWATA